MNYKFLPSWEEKNANGLPIMKIVLISENLWKGLGDPKGVDYTLRTAKNKDWHPKENMRVQIYDTVLRNFSSYCLFTEQSNNKK